MARKKLQSATDQRRFTLAYNDFLESDVLNYYEKMVFIILKKYADSETMRAFPSLNTIHKVTGISLSTVRRSIEHMEEIGVISVEHRNDKEKGHQSNVYTLYDYAEMWKVDSSTEEVAEVAEKLSEAKMIAELRSKGYTVTKEKEPDTLSADQSKDNVSSTKSNHIYGNNTNLNDESCQVLERYTLSDVRDLFEYDAMMNDHPDLQRDIDTAIQILYDAVNTKKSTIRIGGEDKPAIIVIGKLMKLGHSEIMYCIRKYNGQTERIKNPAAYMLTLLYNANEQMYLDVTNQVQYDMNK